MLCKWVNAFVYKPNSRNIYWGKIIPSIVVIIGFIAFIFYNNHRLDKLEEERNKFSRYTGGTTFGEHNNIKGGMVVDYMFLFAGSKFTNTASTKNWLFNKPLTHGGRYYVHFAYNNPTNAELLFQYLVPDSIINIPDSGWTYMPGHEK